MTGKFTNLQVFDYADAQIKMLRLPTEAIMRIQNALKLQELSRELIMFQRMRARSFKLSKLRFKNDCSKRYNR